jgi:hypothetical protein
MNIIGQLFGSKAGHTASVAEDKVLDPLVTTLVKPEAESVVKEIDLEITTEIAALAAKYGLSSLAPEIEQIITTAINNGAAKLGL